MTPSEPQNPAGPAFNQQGQTVQGPQTNISYNVYVEPLPASPASQQQRCDFYQQEQLPPNYVARPELLAEIRNALLQTEANLALTSSLRRTDALFGMGGIGKTVIARALCDDPAIQAAFPHGILWATLGQTPDLAARLRDWISALGGAVPPTALTPEALTNILAQTLSDRRCLLIVDDVWQRAHLKYFLFIAPGCRLLFTTRNADIATEVKAAIRPIPVMARNEAIDLLLEWAGESIIKTHSSLQEAIVERLGRLPLAIKLAGDQLRRHEPTAWLATFDAHKLGKRRPLDLHDSLETTFALSLADLTAEERRLFNALAIFPDDEVIPLCAIAKLWAALAGYAEAETVDLLHYLADRALLQLAPAPQLPKLANHAQITVTFHDLIRDFMATELGVDGLYAGHLALLAAYRQTQHEAGWPGAPDDGYLYDHLVYHLMAIVHQDPAVLAELLVLFASPAWLQVRVPAADYRYDGYLRDLDKTWTAYRISSHANTVDLVQTLPTHIRFALLRTSINSLTANYGPMLVGYAVVLRLWSKVRALSIFSQTTDPLRKAQVGCALLAMGQLTKTEQATVLYHSLAVANAITSPDTQLRTLIALAHHQQGEERAEMLYDLLRLTTALPVSWQQVQAFAEFAHLLLPQHHPAALEWISQLTQIYDQLEAAMHLLIHAKEASLETRKVIGALCTKDYTSIHFITAFHRMTYLCPLADERYALILQIYFASATLEQVAAFLDKLVTLLDSLRKELFFQQVQKAALAIQAEEHRAMILGALVCHLKFDQQEHLFPQMLAAVFAILDKQWQANVLSKLTVRISNKPTVHSSWAALFTIPDELRVDILKALVPHLPGEQRERVVQQALTAVNTIENEGWRAKVLAALLPHLHGEQQEQAVQQALTAASIIWNAKRQAKVLAALIPHLHGEQAVQQALTAADTIKDEGWRAKVLAALLPHLHGEQAVQQALTAANTIKDGGWRAKVLAALLPHLHGEQAVQQALTAVSTIWNAKRQAEVLAALIPHLHGEQTVQQALTAANTIKDEGWRAKVLAALVLHLHGEQREQAVQQALTAASTIEGEEERAKVLAALAPHLHGEQAVQQALIAANTIKDEQRQAEISALFTLHLSRAQQERAFYQALLTTVAIEARKSRTNSTQLLISHLPPEIKGIALVRFLQTNFTHIDPARRTEVLLRLLPYLTELPATHYCHVLKSIDDEWLRATLIDYTLPSLAEDAHAAVAALLPRLSDPLNYAKIAIRLAAQPAMATVEMQLQAAVAISDEQQRVKFYLTLRKALPPQQQTAVNPILAQAFSLLGQPTDVVTAQLFLAAASDHTQRTDRLITLLSFAAGIVDPDERIVTLVSLLPDLEPVEQAAVIEHALSAAQKINAPQQRVAALLPLLPWLASRLRATTVHQLYQDIFTITDVTTRARAFTTLLPYLDDNLRLLALQRAITAAPQIADPLDRIAILTQITATGDQRAAELAQAAALTLSEHRAIALAIPLLLPVINEAEKATLLQQGLQAAWALPPSIERAAALANYLPYVSDAAPIHKELLLVVIETIHARAQDATRAALLDHLATDPLLQLVPLSAEIRLALAHTTAEICNEWNWL